MRRLIAALLVSALASGAHAEEACPEHCQNSCAVADAPVSVDLNHADEASLLELPGIGPARAHAIVEFRARHGGFRSLAQLLQIKGIGRAMLKRLRPLVQITP